MANIDAADGSQAGDSNTEKQIENQNESQVESQVEVPTKASRLHEYRETEGYIIDSEVAGSGAKLAKDGRTVLIPEPSDDPNDPLNWSWKQKHIILIIIAFASFLPDYGSATGAVTLIPQAACVAVIPLARFLGCYGTCH